MKVLIFGSKGWIGGMLKDTWKNGYPHDEIIDSSSRVSYFTYTEVEKEIKEVNPDRIVCLLGRTSGWIEENLQKRYIPNIDYLEEKNKLYENIRDNLYAPILLAILCRNNNIHLTYVGTGCIFSRNTKENDYIYSEVDQPDFTGSSYSTVKGFTDQILPFFDNVLNVRIRMPIVKDYKDPKSFVSKIIGFEKIHSMPNSMTYLPDMLPLLVDLSKMKETGTIHLVNKGGISHSEILKIYKEKINPNHKFQEIEGEELQTILKAARSNNILSTDRLEKLFPEKVRDIRDCIIDMFN
jgi:3,5-epimerase/4-reductase